MRSTLRTARTVNSRTLGIIWAAYAIMSRKWYFLAAFAVCLPGAWWVVQRLDSGILPVTPPTEGISRALAIERAAAISAVRYALTLSVPERVQDPVMGSVTIRFHLTDRAQVVLDFAQPARAISSVAANGTSVPIRSEHGHLLIAGRCAEPWRKYDRHRLYRWQPGVEPQRRVSLLTVRSGARLSGLPVFRPTRHQGVDVPDTRAAGRMGCSCQRARNRS